MPCTTVLDDATAAQLRGSAESDALCDWLDDSSLFALLSSSTAAAASMAVTLRPNVLWPRGYTGSCAGAHSKCAPAQTLAVDDLFPCDMATTPERELCVEPTAVIQAPMELGSCAGSGLLLDGSRSAGGGVRPLAYSWSAPPRSCDNYYDVTAALSMAGSVPTVTLPADALDGGSSFTIVRMHARVAARAP